MALEYFNLYKKYYDVLIENEGIVDSANDLSSDSENNLKAIFATFVNKIDSSKWEEIAKPIVSNNILISLTNEIKKLNNFIKNNLVNACNLSIKSLLPKIEEIKTNNEELDRTIAKISVLETTLDRVLSQLRATSPTITYTTYDEITRKKINHEEENPTWRALKNSEESLKNQISELNIKKEKLINLLNELCIEANNFINSILNLNTGLSSSQISNQLPNYSNVNLEMFFDEYPEAKDMFLYYCPILQQKLGITDENQMYQMLMNAYKDPNVIPRYGTFNNLLNAIVNNCPDNYLDFKFNPSVLNPFESESGLFAPMTAYKYNLYDNYSDKYVVLYEELDVNGYTIKIVQVMPGAKGEFSLFKDKVSITPLEQHFYDIYKANVINVMDNNFSQEIMDCLTSDTDITFVIPYDKEVMNVSLPIDNYAGFYNLDGNICLDPYGSLHNNYYYTDSVIAHELGHKFDATYENNNIIRNFSELIVDIFDGKIDGYSYSSTFMDSRFTDFAQKYSIEVDSIQPSGYTADDIKNDTVEFFACSFDAYINNPDELQTLCPEVYSAIEEMIGGTW